MAKLYCARIECKYNGKNYKCTAQKVNLISWYGKTVNEGYREFLVCGNYEESEETKRLKDNLPKLKGENNAEKSEM